MWFMIPMQTHFCEIFLNITSTLKSLLMPKEKKGGKKCLFSHRSSKDKTVLTFVYFYRICNILIRFPCMYVCS